MGLQGRPVSLMEAHSQEFVTLCCVQSPILSPVVLHLVLSGCLLVPIGAFSLETSVFAREDLRKGAALYKALWDLPFPHRMHRSYCPECHTACIRFSLFAFLSPHSLGLCFCSFRDSAGSCPTCLAFPHGSSEVNSTAQVHSLLSRGLLLLASNIHAGGQLTLTRNEPGV